MTVNGDRRDRTVHAGRAKLSVICLFFALSWTLSASGQSSLIICNKGNVDVNLALVVRYDNAFDALLSREYYEIEGWHVVEKGRCSEVYSTMASHDIYFGFTIRDPKTVGTEMLPVSAGTDNERLYDVDKLPVCVTNAEMHVRRPSREDLGECPAGYFILPMSLYFKSSGQKLNETFTIHPDVDDGQILIDSLPHADQIKLLADNYNKMLSPWVPEYLTGALNHFEGLKSGPARVDGIQRTWPSAKKPVFADNCVVQSTPSRFICTVLGTKRLDEATRNYEMLIEALERDVPGDSRYLNNVMEGTTASAALKLTNKVVVLIILNYDKASSKYYTYFAVYGQGALATEPPSKQ